MDIRRLEVFHSLMKTRSFSNTAEELLLSQPTISGHIKTLEEQIGARLFDRSGREVIPTTAAEVLIEYAARILETRVEAIHAMERFTGHIGGRLKLGGSTIPGGYFLPMVMGGFRRRYDEAYLALVLDDTKGIIDRILSGDIEIGVVGARLSREQLEYTSLVQDEMVLVIAPNHPQAGTASIKNPRHLKKVPFILRESGSGTRTTMVRALKEIGLDLQDLNVIAEMGSTEAVRQAVKAGLGASIVSRVAVAEEIKMGMLKIIHLPDLNLKRSFDIVTHKLRTRSPLCEAFLNYLREYNFQGIS